MRYNIEYSNFKQKGGDTKIILIGGILLFSLIMGIIFYNFSYKKKKNRVNLCDTRKDESKPDSCINCDYGYKNVGLNDQCCDDKETNCNVIKKGDSTAGAICDTRNKQGTKDSCLDCRYGYIKKGLNDWCCQKFEEKIVIKLIQMQMD